MIDASDFGYEERPDRMVIIAIGRPGHYRITPVERCRLCGRLVCSGRCAIFHPAVLDVEVALLCRPCFDRWSVRDGLRLLPLQKRELWMLSEGGGEMEVEKR